MAAIFAASWCVVSESVLENWRRKLDEGTSRVCEVKLDDGQAWPPSHLHRQSYFTSSSSSSTSYSGQRTLARASKSSFDKCVTSWEIANSATKNGLGDIVPTGDIAILQIISSLNGSCMRIKVGSTSMQVSKKASIYIALLKSSHSRSHRPL